MTIPNQSERVREVVDQLLGGRNALALGWPSLDTSRPNIHDSKREFQAELEVVQTTLSHLNKVLDAFIGPRDGDDPRSPEMLARLQIAIDQSARQRMFGLVPKSTTELIQKNRADTGFFINSLFAISDLIQELNDRIKELHDQEKQFWTVRHRPANYYARAIALRLARLYAKEKGKKPTFGTARDGGHPSTDFGRALERIFSILEIHGNVRGAAKWAIDELTEEDLKPGLGGLGMLFGALAEPPGAYVERNVLLEIMTARSEGRDV